MKYTPGGSRVHRYENHISKEFEFAIGDGDNIKAISNHIEMHLGKIEFVFHEVISDQVHIDIHWVKPTSDRPYHTLVTSGMSDKPMRVPDGAEDMSLYPSSVPLSAFGQRCCCDMV